MDEVIEVVFKPLKHGTNSDNKQTFSLYFRGNVSSHYKKIPQRCMGKWSLYVPRITYNI
jgi:hypothetical protein